jgi:hypothetical protein
MVSCALPHSTRKNRQTMLRKNRTRVIMLPLTEVSQKSNF